MNDKVWYNIFKNWINSSEAIETLYNNDVIIELDEVNKLRCKLLFEIIETVKSEVEDE